MIQYVRSAALRLTGARQLLVLFAGFLHEVAEVLVGVQACHSGAGGEAAGVDVALPVESGNDAALAVHVSAGEDGVGMFGSQLGEE